MAPKVLDPVLLAARLPASDRPASPTPAALAPGVGGRSQRRLRTCGHTTPCHRRRATAPL